VTQQSGWRRLPKAANFNAILLKIRAIRSIYKVNLISCIVCSLIITMLIPWRGWALMPISTYKNYSIQGFTVLVNQELLQHQHQANQAREELNSQLQKIRVVMPAKPWQALQGVKIWMEWKRKSDGAAEFHVSTKWLQQHGYYPEKAGGIEISNANNFVKWSRTQQPWMILHELSHAYHFLFLGESDRGITDAYQQAVNLHLYESVDYVSGKKMRAYALTNPTEYFAELSEAYFGKNDFYPFTRQQLAEYDPVGFQLMQQVWESNNKLEILPSLNTEKSQLNHLKIKVVSQGNL
jgi:hypothetical protein